MGPNIADGTDHEYSCIHKAIVPYIIVAASIHPINASESEHYLLAFPVNCLKIIMHGVCFFH